MRTMVFLLALTLVATLVLVPTAAAAHPGPCIHEYVDGFLFGFFEGGVQGAVKNGFSTAKTCVYRGVGF